MESQIFILTNVISIRPIKRKCLPIYMYIYFYAVPKPYMENSFLIKHIVSGLKPPICETAMV